ncbi:MAG TPA: response regulator [candidate division Zixibacteria bacterium]
MSSNLKILVADDNPDHVQLITEILNQELKAEVEGVTKGEECLKKVSQTRYNLLLLDYLFPKINGLDILKEIVEKDYDLPVIMITGHGSEKVAVEAMKAGAIDYIVKSEDGFQTLPSIVKRAIEKQQLKKRLKESEEKFRNIFEYANDAIIYLDRAGRILEVNKQAMEVFGGSKEEVLGEHFTNLSIFNLKDIPTLKSNFSNILSDKEKRLYLCIKNKKGKEITLECSASLMKTDDKVTGVMVIARDITERKRAEELLRIERDRLETVTQNIGAGLAIISKDYRTVWANEVLKHLFGEVDGKICYQTYNHRPNICPGCGVQEVFEKGKDIVVHEQVGKDKDGKTVWSQIIATPMKDKEGNITEALEVVVPITERKKAEEALQVERAQLLSIFDSINQVIYVSDPKTYEILYANKALKDLFQKNLVGGLCYRELQNLESPCKFCTNEIILKEKDKPLQWEYHNPVINKDFMIIDRIIKWSDSRDVRFEIAIDITERKKLQEQLIQTEKLAAVGTLAYGIAHEFNNILAGMLANAELGQVTDEPRQIKECFEIIAENSHRAASITNNLLAFARQKEARKELIDITEPLRSVLAVTRRDLEKLNIEIVEKFKPVPKIYCDAGQLSEVFLNMVTNARDAMHPKGGTLTIQVEPDQDNIRIIFKDTGCGIPEEIRGKIFEPFVTTKGALGGSEVPGTGLGLFLTYGIINGYQGKIEVESKVGKGTQFIISIPVSKNLPPQPVQEIKNEPSGEIERKLKILLVDDEETIVSGLKKFLESRGHQVTSSLRGKEGLRLFKKDKFDLVLSDIAMPDMDGIELIKKIREQDQEIKIIVITGHIMQVKENEAWKAGADEFLIKPFKNEVLCLAISKLMTEI